MIKVEHVDVWGFEHATRGMRNPLNSWDKSDSKLVGTVKNEHLFKEVVNSISYKFEIGDNDLDLMHRLYKAGSEHRKYLRQVFVSMDLCAPEYFFKQFDTYRIGITENSTSTMHKIHAKEFTLDDFSHDHIADAKDLQDVIDVLNEYRKLYLETKNKIFWYSMIQLLPMSYMYTRTVTMNYENAVTIIRQRSGHKLDEWTDFIRVLRDLPYLARIMEGD